MSAQLSIGRKAGWTRFVCAMVWLCLFGRISIECFAQLEAPMSASGVDSANRIKDAKKDRPENYNFKVGPVEFKLSGGLKQTYNDNITLTSSSTTSTNATSTVIKDDFITEPHMGIGALWPISELNNLQFSMGLGIVKYWNHPELDSTSVLVSPDTEFNFNIWVGDVHFILFDKISIQQDPTALPQLSNLAIFHRLVNVAGIDMDWDLNALRLSGGYQFEKFISIENTFESLDSSTHTLNAKVGCPVTEAITAGLQSTFSKTEYDQSLQNGSMTYSFGPFGEIILSEYLRGNAIVSFQQSTFDRGGTINDSSDFSSVVWSAGLQNQLNQWISHSVLFSQSTTLGIGSNFTKFDTFAYKVDFELVQNVTTSLGFNYELFSDSNSATAENGTQYAIVSKVAYQLMENTVVGLGYQRTEKSSNRVGNDYEQNTVFLDITHQF